MTTPYSYSSEVYTQKTGFMGEDKDCSVRAYATAACVSYEHAHLLFSKHGRRYGHSTPGSVTHGVLSQEFPGYKREFCRHLGIKLKTWVDQHSKGHYIVHTNKHALAVIDGVIHDWKVGPHRIVVSYVRLI